MEPTPSPGPWPGHWQAHERLARHSPFSYACAACGRCCRDKGIRVNPYEIARLARLRGTSTTQFIGEFVFEGELRRRDDGSCVFLEGNGCAVHADRPYVCRLYPLTRRRERNGNESFGHDLPHPLTEGRYGESGTVQGWLDAQGVMPYLAAIDRYRQAFSRLLAALAALEGTEGVSGWIDDPREHSMSWMDIDAALGPAPPDADLNARLDAHLRWLEQQLS